MAHLTLRHVALAGGSIHLRRVRLSLPWRPTIAILLGGKREDPVKFLRRAGLVIDDLSADEPRLVKKA